MEIFIEDIPPEGLEITATEGDAWLSGLIADAAGEAFRPGDAAKLEASIHRIDENVTLDGLLEYRSHPVCDRCLEEYEETASIPFHATLAPLYEGKRQMEREGAMEVEIVRDDLEFSYYEGDRFDLGELVREQALLSQPMRHLCREDCRGLCQRCGKDLNMGPCGCVEKGMDPRWEALKSIRIPKSAKGKGRKVKGQGQGQRAKGKGQKAKGT